MRKIKILNLILIVVLCASLFTACNNDKPVDFVSIDVYVPDGAPALSVACLYGNKDIEGVNLTATIVSPTDIQAKVVSGQADMAIVPLNMAANLIAKGADYQLVTINTFGLLYLLTTKEVTDMSQLGGQTIAGIGKANVPQFVLDKVLVANDLSVVTANPTDDQVAVKYYSSGADIMPLLASGVVKNALLGEPAVTKAKAVCKSKGVELFDVDMQKQWQSATDSDNVGYAQAGLIVSNDIIGNYSSQLNKVLDVLKGNKQFLNDNLNNIEQLLSANGSKDLAGTVFTAELIDRCNIDCIMANTMVDEIELFLSAMSVSVPTTQWIFYE